MRYRKNLLILSMLLGLAACNESKKEEPAMLKKVVCGDSVDQQMFDQEGNMFFVKLPGKCDTILEPAPKH
jgi:hypothetical protein